MTKANSTSKGTLYGIRFNQKAGVSHWVSPYAWLNYGDNWYLVKYENPTFWVKWFPFLMNKVSHEAWKVDKKDIFDSPEFQISDNETNSKTPKDALGASKYTVGVIGGPIVAGLLLQLLGLIFPNKDYVPWPTSSVYSCISLVLTSVLLYIAFKTFKINLVSIMRPVKTVNDIYIQNYKKSQTKIKIYFKTSFINKSGAILILKYLFAFSSIAFVLMMLLMKPTAYSISNYDPSFNSTAGVVRSGVVMYIMLLIFAYLPSQTTTVFPVIWKSIDISNISIKENSK